MMPLPSQQHGRGIADARMQPATHDLLPPKSCPLSPSHQPPPLPSLPSRQVENHNSHELVLNMFRPDGIFVCTEDLFRFENSDKREDLAASIDAWSKVPCFHAPLLRSRLSLAPPRYHLRAAPHSAGSSCI